MSKTMKASEFKAKCLSVLNEIEKNGERVVITKHGRAVADLVPHQGPRPKLLGMLKDRLFVTGDIISPIDVEWNALKK
jgi:prevent-host-death family protein